MCLKLHNPVESKLFELVREKALCVCLIKQNEYIVYLEGNVCFLGDKEKHAENESRYERGYLRRICLEEQEGIRRFISSCFPITFCDNIFG